MTDALARRAEEAGLNASAPPQQAQLEGWLIRLSPGKAKRSRCVNPRAAGTLPLPELIARCRKAFGEAGLPLIIRITPYSQPPDLDQRLAALGWFEFDATQVLLRATLDGLPHGPALMPVDAERYASIVGELRGSDTQSIAAHAQRMRHATVEYQGFVLEDGQGQLLSCGQIVVEGGTVGLYDVFTPPVQRGRGHAQALCTALLRKARSEGAVEAYLQVSADNHVARRLYARLGFHFGYAYHYRSDDRAAIE